MTAPTNPFSNLLLKHFRHAPTPDQREMIDRIASFVTDRQERSLLVVKGYAGTGKTSLLSALVRCLPEANYLCALLAPTGRAAKVLSAYSGRPAYTIHRAIYQASSDDGQMRFQRRQNKKKRMIYIVDEASMIPDGVSGMGGWGSSASLLEDLIDYVFQGKECKLILIGDDAQLPPVQMDTSPAVNPKHITSKFHVHLHHGELKQVIRQEADSGILHNATKLRGLLRGKSFTGLRFDIGGFDDIRRISGTELEDEINSAYSSFGEEETIVLCRSNKRANLFNQQIRSRIKWLENEIAAGDLMMVVKNNYFWLDSDSKAGFIANGDIVEVMRIHGTEEVYGFRFANVTIRLTDYPDLPEQDVKILLNAISSERPSLAAEESKQLYAAVMEDYLHISNKRSRYLALKKDPYLNALQVKFSYAITCHKSQGGQWSAVFVDQGYLTAEMIDKEYVRWLYTAVTRATKRLYLVNFHDRFFDEVPY
jgi:exodeoxyribonuclease-5